MSEFCDNIQQDYNARQSSRATQRSSPPNRPPSLRSQLFKREEDDFLEQQNFQPHLSQTNKQQRYTSEQNISSGSNIHPVSDARAYGQSSRYASQANILTNFQKGSECKPANQNHGQYEDIFADPSPRTTRRQERADEPQLCDSPPRTARRQANHFHTFAGDLRQSLQEEKTYRGQNNRNTAPNRQGGFRGFSDDEEDENLTVGRDTQPAQFRQRQPIQNNSNNYTALGQQDRPQPERPNPYGRYNEERKQPGEKREKFKPQIGNATELFDESMNIQKGEMFDDIYGESKDFEVTVTGGDDTKPKITSFEQCNFSEKILKNLALLKYSKPTLIQKHVIPLVQNKKNSILANAETGSGKTAAFILPIINEIQNKKIAMTFNSKEGYPYCLVLEPTRDLAEQLHRDTKAFANQTDVVITVTYGETNVQEAKREIERGCDILIMTIGRLSHFIKDRIVKLNYLHYLILDETDKLLKRDFEEVIVELVIENSDLKTDYRTFMFSATIDEDVQRFIAKYIESSAFCVSVGEVNKAADTIAQKFIEVQKYDKEDFLLELLKDSNSTTKKEWLATEPGGSNNMEYIPERTVVFVAQKRQSDRVAINLAREGFNVISLNADRTAKQRWEAIYKFKKNTYQVLVATDVASRGLNLPQVQHVINLDLPIHEPATYIHRIGRTGRAGNIGHATSFFDPTNQADIEHAPYYFDTLQKAKLEVPPFLEKIVDLQNREILELTRQSARPQQS